MGSAQARPSHRARRRRVVASTIQSAAAAALGLVISVGALGALNDTAYLRMVDPTLPVGRAPLVIALTVAVIALVPRWGIVRWLIGERCGWPVATGGALIAATTALLTEGGAPSAAEADAATLMLAVAGAVTLGGVLLAAAEATARLRLAIGCGLAAGLVIAPLAFAVVVGRAGLGTVGDLPGVVLFGMLAVVGVAATVADRTDPRIDLDRLPRIGVRRAVAPVLVVIGVMVLPVIGWRVRETVSGKLRGALSEKRANLAATVDTVLPYAVAAAVLVLLIWYGYRRAGAPLVRLIVTAAGLGLLLPVGLQVDLLAQRSAGAAVVVVGAAAALAGVLLARRVPRALPWDALGLLAGAGGVVLLGRSVRTEVHSPGAMQAMLLVGGAALALGATLTPLLRPEATDQPGTRTPTETVGTLAVAVAALTTSTVLLGPAALSHITYLRTGFGVYAGPVTLGVLALVLTGIFLFGLAMARILRERAAANIAPPATLYRSTAASAGEAEKAERAARPAGPAPMRLATFEDPPPADDWDLPPSDEVTMVGTMSPLRTTAAPTAPSTPVPTQWPPLSPELGHDDEPDDNDTGIMIVPTDPSRGHGTRNPW
ncbi:hypothetical protein [Luedemannella helvata]|uniref:Uncharacterized protein n=1 Tax=Luedemannella helvata TaxID=349315 RepID=A0ABN2K6X8_9ACTN